MCLKAILGLPLSRIGGLRAPWRVLHLPYDLPGSCGSSPAVPSAVPILMNDQEPNVLVRPAMSMVRSIWVTLGLYLDRAERSLTTSTRLLQPTSNLGCSLFSL